MSGPRLSIVVPVLNEASAIAATLQRLQGLRAAGHEVVVVDGGSSDGTPAACSGLCDRLLQGAQSPRGRARQMNAGAQVAQQAHLLFLHADTVLPDDAEAALQAAWTRADWGRFDVRIEGRSAWFPLIGTLINLRSRLSGIATGDQALFMTRAAFDAVGGFPDQPLMEDVEICRRLRRHAGRPACLEARVRTSGRRWERHGVWRTIVLMWRLRWLYWRGTSPQQLALMYRDAR